jgi:hypothetical protein
MPSALIPYLALVPYAAVALGLAATLALFLSVKLEVQRSARRERKRIDDMLDRLKQATPSPAEAVFIPVALQPGFNVNRRVHAARLLRKGEDIAHIAAVLSVPRAEVELLARVQGMVASKQFALQEGAGPKTAAAGVGD